MTGPLKVPAALPLELFATGFEAHLLELSYAKASIPNHLWLLREADVWLAKRGLQASGLPPLVVEQAARSRRLSPAPLLGYLRSLGVLAYARDVDKTPADKLIEDFGAYLLIERRLAPRTVHLYQRVASRFFSERSKPIEEDLAELGAADINAFVLQECSRKSIDWAKCVVTGLRALFGFLYLNGSTPRPLAKVVPAVANRQGGALTRALDPGVVGLLLASCSRETTLGCRDFAILTVLARLGVRSNEVASLELGDVDWRAGEVLVRGKGRHVDRLPLPEDVGEAIADYLRRRRRPASCRALFLRSCAPVGGLSSAAVGAVVRAACRRAGVRPVGAHSLRHSVATELLREGASLTEIGQLLRHKNLATTTIYAKVDRAALSTLALAWPGTES